VRCVNGAKRMASSSFASSPIAQPAANPSIEGTSNSRLRRLSAAPHVKR
jgi:hypothetical protein